MAWANSSFPVPVSPRSRTVESVREARSASSLAAVIAAPAPTMLPKVYRAPRRWVSSSS